MSELKAYIAPTPDGTSLADYYLKADADAVIADKDKEIMELKGQVNGFKNRSNLWHYNAVEEHKKFVQVDQQITELKEKHKTEVKELLCLIRDKENNFNRAFDSEEKEIRRHKYKRCLAMAKRCEIGAQFQHNNVMQFDNPFYIKRAEWLEKWHKRWLELAEKFKEAK